MDNFNFSTVSYSSTESMWTTTIHHQLVCNCTFYNWDCSLWLVISIARTKRHVKVRKNFFNLKSQVFCCLFYFNFEGNFSPGFGFFLLRWFSLENPFISFSKKRIFQDQSESIDFFSFRCLEYSNSNDKLCPLEHKDRIYFDFSYSRFPSCNKHDNSWYWNSLYDLALTTMQ